MPYGLGYDFKPLNLKLSKYNSPQIYLKSYLCSLFPTNNVINILMSMCSMSKNSDPKMQAAVS